MPKTWLLIMGEDELTKIISEHRPLDVTAAYAWPILGLGIGLSVRALRYETECRARVVVASVGVAGTHVQPVPTCVAVRGGDSRRDYGDVEAHALSAVARGPPTGLLPTRSAAETRPWWASVWLPVAVVLISLRCKPRVCRFR